MSFAALAHHVTPCCPKCHLCMHGLGVRNSCFGSCTGIVIGGCALVKACCGGTHLCRILCLYIVWHWSVETDLLSCGHACFVVAVFCHCFQHNRSLEMFYLTCTYILFWFGCSILWQFNKFVPCWLLFLPEFVECQALTTVRAVLYALFELAVSELWAGSDDCS